MKGLSGFGRQKRVLFENSEEVRMLADTFFKDSHEAMLFQCYRKVKDYLFQNGV